MARDFGPKMKRVIEVGMEGVNGGAASWTILGLVCLPSFIAALLTNWTWWAVWTLWVTPFTIYLYLSFPVFSAWAVFCYYYCNSHAWIPWWYQGCESTCGAVDQ